MFSYTHYPLFLVGNLLRMCNGMLSETLYSKDVVSFAEAFKVVALNIPVIMRQNKK
jgi:hypothetical protein